jgi:hypothetical protein
MVSIVALLLPIVVSAVFVFIVSSVLHMVLKYHRADYKALPNEADAMEALGRQSLAPGLYFMPHCPDHKLMNTPEVVEKFKRGPVGLLTVLPSGPPAMGKNLAAWFGFSVLVGVLVAYLTGRTVAAGADYLQVFRIAGAAAFMAYGVGYFVDPIWKGQPWSNTLRHIFDGLVYSLVTAGVFGWLWPR